MTTTLALLMLSLASPALARDDTGRTDDTGRPDTGEDTGGDTDTGRDADTGRDTDTGRETGEPGRDDTGEEPGRDDTGEEPGRDDTGEEPTRDDTGGETDTSEDPAREPPPPTDEGKGCVGAGSGASYAALFAPFLLWAGRRR